MHDLIVLGAGPVGSYLASISSAHMKVIVIEEHREAGNKACSGLVSGRLKRILPPAVVNCRGVIQHTVRGAKIHVMGNDIEFGKKGTAAYVVDRDLLDKKLAEHAQSSGCEIKFGEGVKRVSVLGDRVEVKTAGGCHESRMGAGCDGAGSVVARSIGSSPPEITNGVIAVEDTEDHSDHVEVWFDKKLIKDGFFWKIPRGAQREYGAMGKGVSLSLLERFFGLKNKKTERKAAPIPIGLVKTFAERILLVGDSACQTKPWSGGGITYGLLSARVASDVITKAVERGDFSERTLSEYQDGWEKILLTDMKAGLAFRELYKDAEGEDVARLLKNAPMIKSAQEKIDFDFPFSSILDSVLKF